MKSVKQSICIFYMAVCKILLAIGSEASSVWSCSRQQSVRRAVQGGKQSPPNFLTRYSHLLLGWKLSTATALTMSQDRTSDRASSWTSLNGYHITFLISQLVEMSTQVFLIFESSAKLASYLPHSTVCGHSKPSLILQQIPRNPRAFCLWGSYF